MATTQNFSWPSSSDVTITGIGNPTGQPVPADAVYIAGVNPEGMLTGVAVTDSGAIETTPAAGSVQHVIVDSSALPTGAATSALQTSGNTTLTTISTTTGSILLDLTNGTQITQITGTVPLPTGAATAANQTNGTQVTSVSNFPATQPISGSVTVVQPTGSNLHVAVDNFPATQPISASTLPLPTGAATAANQATEIASLASIATTSGLSATAAQQTNGNQKTQIVTPTALTVTQAAVTVGTTAVRLTPNGGSPSATRVVLVATPDASSTGKFYIGSNTVTSSGATRGIQIVAGQTFIANNDAGDYWIISDTAAQTVEIMSQG